VFFQGIIPGNQPQQVSGTDMDVGQPVAFPAEEVVMVRFLGCLPARRQAGKGYLDDTAFILQGFKIPVDGGDFPGFSPPLVPEDLSKNFAGR